jgi:L-methionine (R)-S-oxide reductase
MTTAELAIDPLQPKRQLYAEIARELGALIADEPNAIANLANASSLLYHSLAEVNWAGFYLVTGGELVVGPFQGKPACVRIALGRGVCGTAAQRRETILVRDVHEFPGHIACDAASNSEIVVPMIDGKGALLGVLDIDSPTIGRFDRDDQQGLEEFVRVLMRGI